MKSRKKGTNVNNSNTKPSAPSQPAPTTSATPATASAMPPRMSPPLRATAPAQNAPPPSMRTAPKPVRATAAPTPAPRATVSPPKPPVPTMGAMKTAVPPARAGPSQRGGVGLLTRSDRVRVMWMEFDEAWVKPRQAQVAAQLETLLKAAEQNSRTKGKALEQSKDRLVSETRRAFAMDARAEWEARLEKAHLQAEDWTDMTEEEMFAVEQVLSCEEDEEDVGVYAKVQQGQSVAPTMLPGKTAVESSPPLPSQTISGRNAQAPPPAAPQKPPAPAPQQQSWFGWAAAAVKPFQTTVAEVPEEPQKPASAWSAKKNAPIIEEIRAPTKVAPAPQPPPPVAPPAMSRPAQPAAKTQDPVIAAAPAAPSHGFVAYAVPISLLMAPLDSAAGSDPDVLGLVDNAYVNSLRQFHKQAADADAVLARELRKHLPADEREFCIRSHMVAMEQLARGIVEHRDGAIAELLRSRGFGGGKGNGGGGGDSMPPAKVPSVPAQPPGAFPDDGIHVAPVFEPENQLEPEPEREPEPDVDEEIVVPLKGKAAKKKAKNAKATLNGRSTPTPAAAARLAPAAKAAPAAAEKKAAPPVSPWSATAKAATTAQARPASPAPMTINTKLGPTPTPVPAPATNARGRNTNTNTPAPMSPWEAAQAAKGKAPEAKPPLPPNGMWAPPVGRAASKTPYAPTRPSRLAQVSEPESPEPPSPPPTREPTGKDYVAWFAGSSSEDERDADGGLSEDEDQDDDDDDDDEQGSGGAGASWGGGGILGALAGNSKWAMFGEGAGAQPKPQSQPRMAARSATPARGRQATATPVPIPIPGQAAGGRYGADVVAGAGGMGAEWMRWGAPGGGAGPSSFGAGPSSFGAGPSSFGAGPSSFGAGPAGFPGFGAGPGPSAKGRQWQSEDDDDLGNILELTSRTLDRGGDGDVMQAMNAFLIAQQARETLATPVGVRAATPGGRRW